MTDLNQRLDRGPLRVRNLWAGGSLDRVVSRAALRRRHGFVFGFAALAASAALVTFGVHTLPSFTASRDPASTRANAPTTVTFSDGSLAELATRDSTLEIGEQSATHFVATLTGGARFVVVPNRDRSFEVQAGDVRVHVLGTIFAVQELPTRQTHVLVERGRVEVTWHGGSAILTPGQGGAFPPLGGLDVQASTDPPPQSPPAPREPTNAATATRPPLMEAATPSSGWRDDARGGNYRKAYEKLKAKGHDAVHDEAEDLMLAADVARLTGHAEEAVKSLGDVLARHPSDGHAPVAAFTLGRVLLDDLGRPEQAAAAFARSRQLGPTGPLSEDALAREAEAWKRANKRDSAEAVANRYLRDYPQGRHRAQVQSILAK